MDETSGTIELSCTKCGILMFRVKQKEHFIDTVGEIYGKRTMYDTSQGKKLEIECKCPKCTAVYTLYFDQI